MKNTVSGLILALLLTGVSTSILNIEMVSAVPQSPYIMIMPEKTIDSTITMGKNYTISIYTDYAGTDIWGWQFHLTFNPSVLHGGINTTDKWLGDGTKTMFTTTRQPVVTDSEKVYVNQILMTKNVDYAIDYTKGKITFAIAPADEAEVTAIYLGDGVVNGNLITKDKDPDAWFIAGKFNNTAGELSLTVGFFWYIFPEIPSTTSGPGALANVTFTVVGTGCSDIILEERTRLYAPPDFNTEPDKPIYIIDAGTQPDHIGHGLFDNRLQVVKPAVDITPNTLNLKSNARRITAYIQLPEGYNPVEINASTILLNETITPVLDQKYGFITNSSEYLVDHNNDGILERMVMFDGAKVESFINTQGIRHDNVALTITGKLSNGTPFEGTDTIFVFHAGGNGRPGYQNQ